MTKKRILVFIDWYLPGYKAGGPIQSVANMVAQLKDEYEFHIITRDTDYCDTTPYSSIKSDDWNILSDGTRVYYFSGASLTRANMKNLIKRTEFDLVYLNGIYSYYFTLIPLVLLKKKQDKKIVIAARGMFSEGSMNVKKIKKQFFIKAVRVLKLFDKVVFHATTEVEKNEIQNVLGNNINVVVAGNLPGTNTNHSWTSRDKIPGRIKLVNIARISPEKNLLYALRLLKHVRSEVDFDFYGPVYDQQYWIECKQALDELPTNIKASYKGSVESSKVNALLTKYHMLFMPTTGENFGHIILQSLAAGCPVIISDRTPWKKLKEMNLGYDLSLDDEGVFADAIDLAANMGKQEYDKASLNAFNFASNYSNNPELLEQNRLLFE